MNYQKHEIKLGTHGAMLGWDKCGGDGSSPQREDGGGGGVVTAWSAKVAMGVQAEVQLFP